METIPTVAERRAESWREELRQGMKAKERTAIHRVEMNELDPDYRSHNNEEVNQGLTEEQALREAQRCPDCVTPTCMEGCPVSCPRTERNKRTASRLWPRLSAGEAVRKSLRACEDEEGARGHRLLGALRCRL